MAKIFAKWNEDILSSYLIEITAKILERKDDVTEEGYVVDYVSLIFHKLSSLFYNFFPTSSHANLFMLALCFHRF